MNKPTHTKQHTNHDHTIDRGLIPADLLPMDALLAELARAEASDAGGAPRPDLAGRIFDATRGTIAAHTPAPIHIDSARRDASPARRVGAPIRLAAGLALAATLGLAWMAGHGPGPVEFGSDPARSASAAVERDITEWLAISSTSLVSDLQTQVSSLDAEASGLILRLESDESPELWYDEAASGAAGGAM